MGAEGAESRGPVPPEHDAHTQGHHGQLSVPRDHCPPPAPPSWPLCGPDPTPSAGALGPEPEPWLKGDVLEAERGGPATSRSEGNSALAANSKLRPRKSHQQWPAPESPPSFLRWEEHPCRGPGCGLKPRRAPRKDSSPFLGTPFLGPNRLRRTHSTWRRCGQGAWVP